MTTDHLTTKQIADWHAARIDGSPGPAGVAEHLEACEKCQATVETADALLNLAAASIPDEDVECPSASELLGYAVGKLTREARGRVEHHVAECEACRSALEAASESTRRATRRRMWQSGVAIAMAAAFALFLILRDPLVTEFSVGLINPEIVRSNDGAATTVPEFEVAVSVSKPTHLHLFVVDEGGRLTFLVGNPVDNAATFGLYRVFPPGKEQDASFRRRFAILLAADQSLLDRFGEFEHDEKPLSADLMERKEQIRELADELANQFDCVADVAPIPD